MREKRPWNSNKEFFDDYQKLVDRLRDAGHSETADKLADNLRSINGLTDGWVTFGERLDEVISDAGNSFPIEEFETLQLMSQTVWRVVYRR